MITAPNICAILIHSFVTCLFLPLLVFDFGILHIFHVGVPESFQVVFVFILLVLSVKLDDEGECGLTWNGFAYDVTAELLCDHLCDMQAQANSFTVHIMIIKKSEWLKELIDALLLYALSLVFHLDLKHLAGVIGSNKLDEFVILNSQIVFFSYDFRFDVDALTSGAKLYSV